ncbi:MAG: serine hydrolase [Chitinophaga sp.]|uniref:serine hydrolase domain-containing protein n=1 Tax=Chitinophaga sp. TaxID=1869181 RepID=UPI001B1CC2C3|nr:serine hydrolase [Chitinophaga sp.]MBO9730509.1 serine hydrolase [Chitinophaga sp.]
MNTLTYLSRCIIRNNPRITDYQYFPSAPILRNGAIRHFENATAAWQAPLIKHSWQGRPQETTLADLLQQTGSTACIVMQHHRLLLDTYFSGYTGTSVNTSFSVAKSMVSALVGIALEEGAIHSIRESIGRYIPQYDLPGLRDITVAHLLQMCSGLQYREGVTPWSDDARVYYGTHLREQALHTKLVETPGSTYHYNNYNLLLLGLILEKTTGQSVPAYFQEKIWQHIGAEADASWSMDSHASGFAKMESGFNARAMDFVRFGAMCLENGVVNGRQVIPAAWMAESVRPPDHQADTQKYLSRLSPPLCKWAASPSGYYKYLWWGYQADPHNFDYFALGAKGQFIYISPRKQAVVVRFGKRWGKTDWWPGILKQIVDSLE